jgi:hypothetical protein
VQQCPVLLRKVSLLIDNICGTDQEGNQELERPSFWNGWSHRFKIWRHQQPDLLADFHENPDIG